MSKNLIIFDVETTGLDPMHDWIIQLSAIKVQKQDFSIIEEFSRYVLPPEKNFKISNTAQEIHQLTKEFIEKNGEPLKKVAMDFIKFIEDCDLAGYNSNTFDVKFLYNNLLKLSIEFPFENRKYYDVMRMEAKLHPRRLVSVFENYTGKTMDEFGLTAHDAMSDVKATMHVMRMQMAFNNLSWKEIGDWAENSMVSPEGSLTMASDGSILMANGKYRDSDLYDVMLKDKSYIQWWSKSVASPYSLRLAREYCRRRQLEDKARPSNPTRGEYEKLV